MTDERKKRAKAKIVKKTCLQAVSQIVVADRDVTDAKARQKQKLGGLRSLDWRLQCCREGCHRRRPQRRRHPHQPSHLCIFINICLDKLEVAAAWNSSWLHLPHLSGAHSQDPRGCVRNCFHFQIKQVEHTNLPTRSLEQPYWCLELINLCLWALFNNYLLRQNIPIHANHLHN